MFSKNLKYLRLRDNISQDELAQELGYKSYTTIQKWETGLSEPNMGIVNKLADKWKLTLDELVNVDLEARRYDTSHPNNQQPTNVVPLAHKDNHEEDPRERIPVYGEVCAGDGIWALEGLFDEIYNPYPSFRGDAFALVVKGDSMNNVVDDGMYAIIQKQPMVDNGEIAVVLIDGDISMLKRFYQLDESTVVLKPDSRNPKHKTLMFENEEINQLYIIGKYIGCVSPMC